MLPSLERTCLSNSESKYNKGQFSKLIENRPLQNLYEFLDIIVQLIRHR